MSFLDSLLGGGQQQDFQGFVNRYEQGQPSEGYSDAEVLNRYQQVAPQLPQSSFVQAAEAAFNRMPPQQRAEFGQTVQQQAQQQGISIPGLGAIAGGLGGQSDYQSQMQNPGALAQMVGALHQQDPGLLPQLLSSGMSMMGGGSGATSGGGLLASPAAKSALAGIAAMAVKQFLGNRGM